VFCRRIAVSYASHSPQVDPILGSIAGELSSLSPGGAQVPFYSTVRGGALLEGPELDGSYWADNLRCPVRLDQALGALSPGEETVFLEMSGHPLLVAPLSSSGHAMVASLRRDTDAASSVRMAAA